MDEWAKTYGPTCSIYGTFMVTHSSCIQSNRAVTHKQIHSTIFTEIFQLDLFRNSPSMVSLIT